MIIQGNTMNPKPNQSEINQECNNCEKIACPKSCFNRHVGSMIALQKLLDAISRESGEKIYLCGG